MDEIWKDIKGFEGLYQVSNMGRVRSLLRNGLIRKQKLFGNTDYLYVVLLKDRKYTRLSVHRLVAEHFVEGYKEGYVVNHKDEKINTTTERITSNGALLDITLCMAKDSERNMRKDLKK